MALYKSLARLHRAVNNFWRIILQLPPISKSGPDQNAWSYVPYSLRKVCGFFNVFSLPVMSRSSFFSSSEKTETSSHLMQQDSAQQKRKAMIPTRLLYVTLVKTYESKVHVNISILYRSELLPSSYWWNWYHQWQSLGQRHLPQTTADK